MRTLSQADSGTSLEVTVGEVLQLALPENATTGYRWEIAECDRDRLEQVGETMSHPTPGIGSGGTATFTFRAICPGTSRLVLEQRRSWESMPAAESFKLTIEIREP